MPAMSEFEAERRTCGTSGDFEGANAAAGVISIPGSLDAMVRGLSLIDDLSAVIAASDPSERRTKFFGIDRGRKRCQVAGFCNSAGATQKRRYQTCIEIRQARPKSAREILRQRVIGMLLVFGGTAYLVHVTNRVPRRPLGRQARHDLGMLLRDIEPVERVEQNEAVALGNKERFPVLPCRP